MSGPDWTLPLEAVHKKDGRVLFVELRPDVPQPDDGTYMLAADIEESWCLFNADGSSWAGGPWVIRNRSDEQFADIAPYEALTLRDRFAATAPISLFDAAIACGFPALETDRMTDQSYRVTVCAVLALMRYEYADAMLEARK